MLDTEHFSEINAVTGGLVELPFTPKGDDITDWSADVRGKAGLFLAFQYPIEIPGVSIANFLRTALQAHLTDEEELDIFDFSDMLTERMSMLEMDVSFAERHVNDGFSGGEKKRNEILQMAVLRPTLAIMDETDSGLDIDALKIVADGINALRSPERAMIVITHYQRLLEYVVPDYVHVLADGRVVRSGGKELALELEEKGYSGFTGNAEAAA